MSAWATLKALIDANIVSGLPNGIRPEEEHNPVLQSIVDTFGEDYTYMGLATTATNPINDDNQRMYISTDVGTYNNFLDSGATALEVELGEVCVLKGISDVWEKEIIVNGDSISGGVGIRIYDNASLLQLQVYKNGWVTIAEVSYDGTNFELLSTNLVVPLLTATDVVTTDLTTGTLELNGVNVVSQENMAIGESIVQSRIRSLTGTDPILKQNNAAYVLANLIDLDLLKSAKLVMIPSMHETGKLTSIMPSDGSGDFTVARTSTKTRINSEWKIEEIAANIPCFDYREYGNYVPELRTDAAYTQLITYSNAFGNSYYSKSGATIEGDASTAGSEFITVAADRDLVVIQDFGL